VANVNERFHHALDFLLRDSVVVAIFLISCDLDIWVAMVAPLIPGTGDDMAETA
jgi:hypothetical protein